MGKAKPVKLQTREFATRSEAKVFFREILYRYVPGDQVNGTDARHLAELFLRHEHYAEKSKGGFATFGVTAADYNTQCFCLIRGDGSREEYSFDRCIEGSDNA